MVKAIRVDSESLVEVRFLPPANNPKSARAPYSLSRKTGFCDLIPPAEINAGRLRARYRLYRKRGFFDLISPRTDGATARGLPLSDTRKVSQLFGVVCDAMRLGGPDWPGAV